MGVALAPLALAAGVAGAGITAVSQVQAMEAKSANAAYQAQVAANNAKIATQNAGMDTEAGEIATVNEGLKTRAMVGKTKAAQGASGVDVNSGSFVAGRAAESEIGMLDALTIRSNAARKAWADTVDASSQTAESQLLTSESEQISAQAPLVGIGSLLSSASSLGGNYAKFKQTAG